MIHDLKLYFYVCWIMGKFLPCNSAKDHRKIFRIIDEKPPFQLALLNWLSNCILILRVQCKWYYWMGKLWKYMRWFWWQRKIDDETIISVKIKNNWKTWQWRHQNWFNYDSYSSIWSIVETTLMWFEGQIEADFMSITVLMTARNLRLYRKEKYKTKQNKWMFRRINFQKSSTCNKSLCLM